METLGLKNKSLRTNGLKTKGIYVKNSSLFIYLSSSRGYFDLFHSTALSI